MSIYLLSVNSILEKKCLVHRKFSEQRQREKKLTFEWNFGKSATVNTVTSLTCHFNVLHVHEYFCRKIGKFTWRNHQLEIAFLNSYVKILHGMRWEITKNKCGCCTAIVYSIILLVYLVLSELRFDLAYQMRIEVFRPTNWNLIFISISKALSLRTIHDTHGSFDGMNNNSIDIWKIIGKWQSTFCEHQQNTIYLIHDIRFQEIVFILLLFLHIDKKRIYTRTI